MDMRLDDVEMLVASGRATSHQIQNALGAIFKELETSGETRLLSAIDVCNTQIASSVVGIFSLYESRLQSAHGWGKPFDDVQRLLVAHGAPNQAEEFKTFRLAVNVLKHGKGASHTKLLARADRLPFAVQSTTGALHEEGDVCPPSDLILVSVEFLELCCEAIEKSWAIVQTAMQDTLTMLAHERAAS
jgi:hypothetical protein